ALPYFVGNVRLFNARQRFTPLHRSTFAIREKWRLAPNGDSGQASFAFTSLARFGRVHVDTKRAAIDLRSAQSDQGDQRFFQAAASDVLLDPEHRLHGVRADLGEVEAGFHSDLSVVGLLCATNIKINNNH